MPCNDGGPSLNEIRNTEARNVELRKRNDELAAQNDRLREYVLAAELYASQNEGKHLALSPEVAKLFEKEQTEHRKVDLKRLQKTFLKKVKDHPAGVNYERLGRILAADPTKPLESQLGFDPDQF